MCSNSLVISKHHTVPDVDRGTLSVVECGRDVPFQIKRIFYLYDLPEHGVRANHAHRKQSQYITCLEGSITLSAINKTQNQTFVLSTPTEGLHIPPMTWVRVNVIRVPVICLVLCSGLYDESDYIRNFEEFQVNL